MSDVTIGAVMEVLGGEYYGGILGGIDELGRRAASLLLLVRRQPLRAELVNLNAWSLSVKLANSRTSPARSAHCETQIRYEQMAASPAGLCSCNHDRRTVHV
jgi:hypothetical protein